MPTGKQDKDFSTLMEGNITITATALDEAVVWISKNLNPDDVFSNVELERWAENYGYTKE